MTRRQLLQKIPFKLLAVFLLLTAGICAGGYFYFLKQRARAVEHIQSELATIAQLKSEEITAWRKERYGDAFVVTKSQQFASSVRRWYQNPGDKKLKSYIYNRLDAFRIYETYKDLILVDPAGKIRMFIDQGGSERLSPATLTIVKEAERQDRIIFSDFYYCGQCQEVHLDVIAPLHDGETNAGALVLRINPDKYLYPLIQRWPSASKSGETVLLRKEGNEIVYLNDLRHQKGAALKLRLPLTDTLLPAAMAALGREGMAEGNDYRGVPVAADVRHIADSPWFMVSKMDKEEIYAPLKRPARNILIVIFLVITLLAAILSFIWQADRRDFYKKQYQQELEKRALIRHYDYLTMYANDIIFLLDENRKVVEINERGVKAYGYTREEMIGMDAERIRVEELRPQFRAQMGELAVKGNMLYETMHRRKDGTAFPVEISARHIEIENKKYLQGIVRDITERRLFEQKIQDRTEELEATNQELMATEEELRKQNEELTASEEELKASEEELQQQNGELQKAQDEITQHTLLVKLLHQCSLELASMPAGQPVNELLTDWLKKISGGFAVTFGEYDRNNKEIVLKRILLEPGALSKIEETVGKRLQDLRSPVSPGSYREMMADEVAVRHSLHDISFGSVPKLASVTIGAMLGLDRFEAIPYHTEGILYGTSVIAFKKGQPEPDQAILKAFSSLGAVSLRRAQAEANLQTSHEELQANYQELESNNQQLQAAEEEIRKQNEELLASEEELKVAGEELQHNLEELQTSQKRYNELFHGINSGVAVFRAVDGGNDFVFVDFNRAGQKIEKTSADKVIGRKVTEVFPGIKSMGLLEIFQRVWRTGESELHPVSLYQDGHLTSWRKNYVYKLPTGEVVSIYEDLTEIKQAEEELRENARLLSIAGSTAKMGGWSVDLKNNLCTWSDETAAIHEKPAGYAPSVEEGIYFYAPEWRDKIAKVFTECAQKGIPYDEEMEIITANGRRVWVRTIGEPVKDEAGKIVKVQGAFQDITERKQAEEKIIESEQKFSSILHNTRDVIWSLSWPEMRVNYLSPSVEMLYGRKVRDFVQRPALWQEMTHPEDAPGVEEAFRKLRETGKSEREARIVRPDGTIIWVSDRSWIVFGENGSAIRVDGITTDITERKRAEEARQVSEMKYRRLFESAKDGILILNAETGVIDDANPFIKDLLGYPREELIGKELWQIGLFRDIVASRDSFMELQKKGYVRYEDLPLQTKDGQKKDVEFVSNVYPMDGHNVVQCNIRDITVRKQAEEQIKLAARKWETTFDSIGDGVCLLDRQWKVLQCNQAFTKLLNKPYAEILGRTCYELVHGLEEPLEHCPVARMERSLRRETLELERDGKFLLITADPIFDRQKNLVGAVHIISDISGRKLMEQELLQAQKMEAVGFLAGGVAHDFNNMLAGIVGNAELLQLKVYGQKELENYVDNIIKASGHAAGLTKQLLAFARKGHYHNVPVNVHKVIAETLGILGNTIDRRIKIEQHLRANPAVILGDHSQLENALMNLGINARDAMPQGGRLIFSTDLVNQDEEYILRHNYKIEPGHYVQVSVEDTGCGMSDEVKKHLFEPFFTTKEKGRGTGLGLAGVYGCVKNHGGSVEVYSEPGRGTSIKLYLPLYAEPKTAGEQDPAQPNELPVAAGTGSILIVDDEDMIRTLAAHILKTAGYRVQTCADGQEAVELYAKDHGNIDLVIMDMVMPRLDGREAFNRMREINPQVKMLLSSGFSEDGDAQAILKDGASGFIQKPYRSAELLLMVQQALQTTPNPSLRGNPPA
jgi:PAS domain S-box-containing protein